MGHRVAIAAGMAGLLAAAGARRPVIRRWPASIAQAAPCLPASEAPGVLSALHLGVAALELTGGGWRGRWRRGAGAALNVAAAAALADLRRDAVRSARVYDDVLVALGRGAEPSPRMGWGRATRRRHLRAADVAFGTDPAQRLDVWGPAAAVEAPVLVHVHGGGWTGGDKALEATPLLAYLVEQGWVCVAVNYRLAPEHRWPAMIVDVKRAIAWVREHVAEFGGDPSFVAVSGGSAGGHLAALAALTPGDPAFQPGFPDVDTSVAAAVPAYGVFDFSIDEYGLFALLERTVIGTTYAADTTTWLAASPLHRAGPDAPPFLVVHGSADPISSVGQSRRFVRRLRDVGTEVHYAELPRAQHAFDRFPTARTAHHVRAVHRFLEAVHARHRPDPVVR